MPSSSPLVRPTEWPERDSLRYRSTVVLSGLLGVAGIPVGFGFVAIGKPGGLKYGLLFAALFLLAASYAYVTRVRPKHGLGDIATSQLDGQPVTEIRYSSLAFGVLTGLMVCMTAIFLLASLDYYLSAPSGKVTAPYGATIVFGLIGLFFASFVALVALGRLRRGKLVLSQQGIHQRGWAFSSFLPWQSFAGVKAADNGGPEVLVIAYSNAAWDRRQIVRFWKIDQLPPVPMIEVHCASLAVDPNLVYWLLKFYVENPGARGELGTDAAIRRARSGAFG